MQLAPRSSFDINSRFLTATAELQGAPPLALSLILKAILQSGIREIGGSTKWLTHPSAQQAIIDALEAHGGKARKNDQHQSRLVHEIWLMHRAYNNKDLTTWLKQKNLDPFLGVIAAGVHDRIENERKLAEERGKPFHIERALDKILSLTSDSASKPVLASLVSYITDKKKTDHDKTRRYAEQYVKSFDKQTGQLTANALEQKTRLLDKLSHVVMDAEACKRGLMTPEQALQAYTQAALKMFPLEFPVSTQKNRQEYLKSMRVLRMATQMTDQRLEAHLAKAFEGYPELEKVFTNIMTNASTLSNFTGILQLFKRPRPLRRPLQECSLEA